MRHQEFKKAFTQVKAFLHWVIALGHFAPGFLDQAPSHRLVNLKYCVEALRGKCCATPS